jgi:hypothetical protein
VAAPPTPPTASQGRAAARRSPRRLPLDEVKVVGGLIALIAGVIVVGLLAGGALIADPDNAAPIATAASGVIGSIVGAYLGIKIGTDGTQKALRAQQDEATRAQVFAAHLNPDKAELALEQARAIVNDRPLPTQSREPS